MRAHIATNTLVEYLSLQTQTHALAFSVDTLRPGTAESVPFLEKVSSDFCPSPGRIPDSTHFTDKIANSSNIRGTLASDRDSMEDFVIKNVQKKNAILI